MAALTAPASQSPCHRKYPAITVTYLVYPRFDRGSARQEIPVAAGFAGRPRVGVKPASPAKGVPTDADKVAAYELREP